MVLTLLQLLKSEELALYVIFSSGKQSVFIRTFVFLRFSTAFKLMQYFLLYLPESSISHCMPHASRTALALGRKGQMAAACALQRAQTAPKQMWGHACLPDPSWSPLPPLPFSTKRPADSFSQEAQRQGNGGECPSWSLSFSLLLQP